MHIAYRMNRGLHNIDVRLTNKYKLNVSIHQVYQYSLGFKQDCPVFRSNYS